HQRHQAPERDKKRDGDGHEEQAADKSGIGIHDSAAHPSASGDDERGARRWKAGPAIQRMDAVQGGQAGRRSAPRRRAVTAPPPSASIRAMAGRSGSQVTAIARALAWRSMSAPATIPTWPF